MTTATEVLKPDVTTATETAEATNRAPVRVPALDIVERADDVVLTVDLPGVEEQALEVSVENGLLTIAGNSQVAGPEGQGFEQVYAEHEPVTYRRVVRLSDRLHAGGISAQLRQGVLRIVVPKRDDVKPRRVPIAAG